MATTETAVVQSERLTLRVYEPADSAPLFEMVGSLMPNAVMEDEAAVQEWIDQRRADQAARGYSIWAVTLRSSGRLIGNCGFVGERDGLIELGWGLKIGSRGKGYATEAGKAAMAFAYEHLDATSIVATIRAWNDPSIAVADRLGMRQIDLISDDSGDSGDLLVFRVDRDG